MNANKSKSLTSKNLQWVFSDLIGTKFKLNDTNRLVHSTSLTRIFSKIGGIDRFSSDFLSISGADGLLYDCYDKTKMKNKHTI